MAPAATPEPPAIRLDEVRSLAVREVAGLMTGTSMDGLDVALCRLTVGDPLEVELVAFETVPMPTPLRASLQADQLQDIAAVARANQALGGFFADALAAVLARRPRRLHLIGSHGQTVYHEHGRTTLQLGDPSPLALRFGCPVVHDFRMSDIAAGGCGAPLVPYVDHRLLGGRGEGLLAVNIGGIANLTALPRGARPDQIQGFDCGPGNMLLDELARRYSHGRLAADLDGALAAAGTVQPALLDGLLGHPFFAASPPKSAGREQFGPAFVDALLAKVAPATPAAWHDLFATCAELTAVGIADGYRRYVAPAGTIDRVVVSGGGARNPELMRRLRTRLQPLPVAPSDGVGLPVDAKEAIAFAVLASDRIDQRPCNLPAVTGAARPVLLGKITEC